MGFFEKFKRKKDIPQRSQPTSTLEPNTGVIVLFDRPNIEIKEIQTMLAEKFGADSILPVDDSHPSATHLMLKIDGMDVVCFYMPFPLPKEEGDIGALLNFNHYISEEEQAALAEHKSFCLITEIGGGKTLAGKRDVCLMLTKLCGSLLNVQGAVGVYYSTAHLLLGKKMYLNYALITEQEAGNPDYFPSILWILVYQTHDDDGVPIIETCGLDQFGFLELKFYDPKEEWAQSYEKIYIMSLLQITGKEVYKNMDTISFTKDTISIFKQNGNKLSVIGGI